jgi:type 1 glutamine amidotransferase
MKFSIKRVLLWLLLAILALLAVMVALNWNTLIRFRTGGLKEYETTAPNLPANIPRPAILVFSKTNGFRHAETIVAANQLLEVMAKEKGWGYYFTENGATFNPELLAKFDAVVFNNVSGDPFTPDQRTAFKSFLERGGGFVGIHGSGGDPGYLWDWYVNDLIGAQFIGHTMNPQFPPGTLKIEDSSHPATRGMPATWSRGEEEWYSFDKSVRAKGYHVLLSLDEASYEPKGMWGQDLRMGGDHPMVWWHCVGKGRALYSALGHKPEYYAEPNYIALLKGAVSWAARQDGEGCDAEPPK